MTAPREVGVLALQGDVREHLAVLESLGARASSVRRPGELERVEALVIPGGESTTMERLARQFGLLEPIRTRLDDGMPALGTCAGMIMLADRLVGAAAGQGTFGGLDITVRRNAFGGQIQSFESDLDVVGLDEPVRAVFIRAPWVEDVGTGVEVLASIATGPHAGRIVAVRQGRLTATSFHPEIAGEPRIHQRFLERLAD